MKTQNLVYLILSAFFIIGSVVLIFLLVIDTVLPTNELIKVDFPALVLPIKAILINLFTTY